MMINRKTTLEEINNASVFAQAKDAWIGGGAAFFHGEAGKMTIEELQGQHPTWFAEDIIYGVNRLQQIAESGTQYIYNVYSDERIAEDSDLGNVKLFYLPGSRKEPFAILLAGGAYGAVCTLVESLPVAAKLNEMGMTVFCLNYRTAKAESFQQGLMPKPLDDLAEAYRFITDRAEKFGVEPGNYFVGGFSAGGHVAAMWGTEHLGCRKYNIPMPKILMLAYPLVTIEDMNGELADYMAVGMFGTGYTEEIKKAYSVHRNIDANYPAVYIVQSMDDDAVSPEHAVYMGEALAAAGVRFQSERPKTGGHGFGLGSNTPISGWVERAVDFMHNTGMP